MDADVILALVKSRLGISGNVRDDYLMAITKGVLDELSKVQGLDLEPENNGDLLFIVDYVAWRYDNRETGGFMPRHIYWRLKNLMIHGGG